MLDSCSLSTEDDQVRPTPSKSAPAAAELDDANLDFAVTKLDETERASGREAARASDAMRCMFVWSECARKKTSRSFIIPATKR